MRDAIVHNWCAFFNDSWRTSTVATRRVQNMKLKHSDLVRLLPWLRWLVPIGLSLIGIGYILFEQLLISGRMPLSLHVVITLLILGLVGPAVAWVTLTWATNLALRNANLHERSKRKAVHTEIAGQVGKHVTAILDVDTFLYEVVALIQQRYGFDYVHIFLVDSVNERLVLKESSGPAAEKLKASNLRLKISEADIVGIVASSGEAVLSNNAGAEPWYAIEPSLPEIRAELAVPLRLRDNVIGVLNVQSRTENDLDEEDVANLQMLSNQIAIALENARLFRETKHRHDAMIALHETSLDMISKLDKDMLLQGMVLRGLRLFNAQSGALYLYDQDNDLIYQVAGHNTWQDWIGLALRPGEGVIGQVVLTGKPLLVNDYEQWANKAKVFTGMPYTVIMGAPLRWRERTIGGIIISNEPQRGKFSQNDLWLLGLFADLASIAIINAELHKQIKDFSQDLERKVEEKTHELATAKEEIAAKAKQLRELLNKTIRIQEEEQARMARDMHDGVIQLLVAARYELQAARLAAQHLQETSIEEKLNPIREVLIEIEREIRHAIFDLHPPILNSVGLVAALEKYVQNYREYSGIETCEVAVKNTPVPLPASLELAAFRMVQEALRNIAAHSEANRALVTLCFGRSQLSIVVEDNGKGFDYQHSKHHSGNSLGLVGMQERVNGLRGELKISSKEGHGTRLTIRLPVSVEEL
jgi:signal transduction histidine kinase